MRLARGIVPYQWLVPAAWLFGFALSWCEPGPELVAVLIGASPASWWGATGLGSHPLAFVAATTVTGVILGHVLGRCLERLRVPALVYAVACVGVAGLGFLTFPASVGTVPRIAAALPMAAQGGALAALLFELARRWIGMVRQVL